MTTRALPIVDLHRHLDGNIRPKTVWELAQQCQATLPVSTFDEFLPYIQVQNREADLLSFLNKLDWGVSVLHNLDACKRIAFENVEDAHLAGLSYVELRFSPYYMSRSHQLVMEAVIDAIVEGIKLGQQKYNVQVGLIGILSRTNGVATCLAELNAILARKTAFCGLDLAGDEIHYPAHWFIPHFKRARDAGLAITVHAGEAMGPESVWAAIKLLGAKRIGHGVAIAQDRFLIDYIHQHEIGIESCLTSNLQTGTVQSLNEHPLPLFLNNDLLVSLNSDDPAIEGIDIPKEYRLAKAELNLTTQQIEQLKLNGIKSSFLSCNEQQRLLTTSAH